MVARNLTVIFSYLMGSCKENRIFLEAHRERTKGQGHKLQQEKFDKLLGKLFCTESGQALECIAVSLLDWAG